MASMEYQELKFLLRLAECKNGETSLANIKDKTLTAQAKNTLCQSLGADGLVNFDQEIDTVAIAPPGQELLNLKPDLVTIPAMELKVLEKIAKSSGGIKPSTIKPTINKKALSAPERDHILKSFIEERGYIQAVYKLKAKGAKVRITDKGQQCLGQLDEYFQSLRQTFKSGEGIPNQTHALPTHAVETETLPAKPTDLEILQIIQDLDRELGTDNYLPIFHVRSKLQPPMSRDEVDQALYRLENANKIRLNAIVHTQEYAPEQLSAGISQKSGGALFFIRAIAR